MLCLWPGLNCWFLLLRYSVVCTVESLSSSYLLVTRDLSYDLKHPCALIHIRIEGEVGTVKHV